MADFLQNLYNMAFPERKLTPEEQAQVDIQECQRPYDGNKEAVMKRAREYVKNRKEDILEVEVKKDAGKDGVIKPCFISNTIKCINVMKKEGIYDKKSDADFNAVLKKLNDQYAKTRSPALEGCYKVFNEQEVKNIFQDLTFEEFQAIMEGRPDKLKRYARQGLAITSLALMANAALTPLSKARLEKRVEKKEEKKLVKKVASAIEKKKKKVPKLKS
jgi:hypothetical protein